MHVRKKAVVLSSGGVDSTTVMAIAVNKGFEIYSLSFSYGQRHGFELKAAARVARFFNVKKHLVLDMNLRQIGGSALTDDIDVPKSRMESEMSTDIPVTYVPARNTIFLSYALAWAEVLKAFDIFIGVNAIDYSGYPDCRPEYLQALERVANLGTRAGVESGRKFKLHAPLMRLTKKEIIERGKELGVDYSMTHSCYDPDKNGKACGECDACLLRLKGFAEAGFRDPVQYQQNK